MIPSFNGSVVTPSAVGVDESGNLVAETGQEEFFGKRILLSEDNDLNWEIAEDILTEAGFEVERLRQQYQKDYDKQEKFISGGIIMRGIPTGVRHR